MAVIPQWSIKGKIGRRAFSISSISLSFQETCFWKKGWHPNFWRLPPPHLWNTWSTTGLSQGILRVCQTKKLCSRCNCKECGFFFFVERSVWALVSGRATEQLWVQVSMWSTLHSTASRYGKYTVVSTVSTSPWSPVPCPFLGVPQSCQ